MFAARLEKTIRRLAKRFPSCRPIFGSFKHIGCFLKQFSGLFQLTLFAALKEGKSF